MMIQLYAKSSAENHQTGSVFIYIHLYLRANNLHVKLSTFRLTKDHPGSYIVLYGSEKQTLNCLLNNCIYQEQLPIYQQHSIRSYT